MGTARSVAEQRGTTLTMPRILILFAHPRLEKSRINRALLNAVRPSAHITVRDLYELYPEFNVNVAREQGLLAGHDIIVLHHPFYWYSIPPLLKQYIDLVYAFGWAYGTGGDALRGKVLFHAITTGGGAEAYTTEGFHGRTLAEFMAPLERTATLCGMTWLPPFAVQGTNRIDDATLARTAQQYARLLEGLASGQLAPNMLTALDRLNDAVPNT
jgi:glutathione-regulated potassium-efflux system ancillary protein KefG